MIVPVLTVPPDTSLVRLELTTSTPIPSWPNDPRIEVRAPDAILRPDDFVFRHADHEKILRKKRRKAQREAWRR